MLNWRSRKKTIGAVDCIAIGCLAIQTMETLTHYFYQYHLHSHSKTTYVPFLTPMDFMTLAILETSRANSAYVTFLVWPTVTEPIWDFSRWINGGDKFVRVIWRDQMINAVTSCVKTNRTTHKLHIICIWKTVIIPKNVICHTRVLTFKITEKNKKIHLCKK